MENIQHAEATPVDTVPMEETLEPVNNAMELAAANNEPTVAPKNAGAGSGQTDIATNESNTPDSTGVTSKPMESQHESEIPVISEASKALNNELATTPVVPSVDNASLETLDNNQQLVDELNTNTKINGVNAAQSSEAQTTAMETETNNKVAAVETKSASAAQSALSMLATYNSDDHTDSEDEEIRSVEEVPVTNNKQHRKQVVEVSSSSDSSSTSDSDSEGEYLTVLRKEINKKMDTVDCDEEDDEFEDDASRPRRRQPPKVRGELLLDDLPPIEQLEITVPEDECVELGKVQSIVDQLVLVSVLPNSMLFDLDTVLFLEKGRKVLGQVFDVLGQVADPIYCVRFNSNKQIIERGINIGDVVYCAPKTEHTQFVILSKLMQVRGSDASWENDVEPPPRYIDYSDDEQEREARQERRKKRTMERSNSNESIETVDSTITTDSSVASSSTRRPRQRGRRATREFNTAADQIAQQRQQQQQQPYEGQYNYHPSYNQGSWHSNYYPYQAPVANFNMPPPSTRFPVPNYGYGMPPPPQAYGMMPMPPTMHPPGMMPRPPYPPTSGS